MFTESSVSPGVSDGSRYKLSVKTCHTNFLWGGCVSGVNNDISVRYAHTSVIKFYYIIDEHS